MQEKKKKGRKTGAGVQEMTERRQADGWQHTAIQQRRKTQARSQVEQITAEQDAGGRKEETQRGEKKRGGENRKVAHSKQLTGAVSTVSLQLAVFLVNSDAHLLLVFNLPVSVPPPPCVCLELVSASGSPAASSRGSALIGSFSLQL